MGGDFGSAVKNHFSSSLWYQNHHPKNHTILNVNNFGSTLRNNLCVAPKSLHSHSSNKLVPHCGTGGKGHKWFRTILRFPVPSSNSKILNIFRKLVPPSYVFIYWQILVWISQNVLQSKEIIAVFIFLIIHSYVSLRRCDTCFVLIVILSPLC